MGFPDNFNVTAESLKSGEDIFHCAVSKLVIRETTLLEKDDGSKQAFATRTKNIESRKCFFCGKNGHIAKHC